MRVYGSGWELPGAEVVRDVRQMQAARNGRIHINFAKTRAATSTSSAASSRRSGPAASSARRASRRWSSFFEYGREIVEFADADELVVRARRCSADPDRLERIRRAAFQRLVHEHLYEHRWLKLFADIERDLDGERGRDPDTRAGRDGLRDARRRRARLRVGS